jgi:hypothetical protein
VRRTHLEAMPEQTETSHVGDRVDACGSLNLSRLALGEVLLRQWCNRTPMTAISNKQKRISLLTLDFETG